MTMHRRVWNVVAAVFAALGVLFAVVESPPGDLFAVAVVGAFIGAMMAILGVGTPATNPDDAYAVTSWRTGLRVIGVAVVIAVALRGLIGTIGGSGLLIAFALVLAHPATVDAIRRRTSGASALPPATSAGRLTGGVRRAGAAPSSTTPSRTTAGDVPPPVIDGPLVPPEPVRTSSTADLCRRWRRSFLVLQGVRAHAGDDHDGAVERVVADRAAVLDELAARDPSGFQRWIDAGARAASDPARYLDLAVRPRPDTGDVAAA